jgi:hypothetical protein
VAAEVTRPPHPTRWGAVTLACLALSAGCEDRGAGRYDAYRPGLALEEALAACGCLEDPELVSWCRLDLREMHGVLAEEHCGELPPGTARDECYFVLSERPGSEGPAEAYRLCALAGDLAEDCALHLWQTEISRLLAGSEPGGAAAGLRELAAAHHGSASTYPQLGQRLTELFWEGWWARRSALDPEECRVFADEIDRRVCQGLLPAVIARLAFGGAAREPFALALSSGAGFPAQLPLGGDARPLASDPAFQGSLRGALWDGGGLVPRVCLEPGEPWLPGASSPLCLSTRPR